MLSVSASCIKYFTNGTFQTASFILSGSDKTQGSSKWHLIRLSVRSNYVTLKFAMKRKMANCPQLWHQPSFGVLAPPLGADPLWAPLPVLRARAKKPREVSDSTKSSNQPWLLETLGNRLENIKWLWINKGTPDGHWGSIIPPTLIIHKKKEFLISLELTSARNTCTHIHIYLYNYGFYLNQARPHEQQTPLVRRDSIYQESLFSSSHLSLLRSTNFMGLCAPKYMKKKKKRKKKSGLKLC